MKPLFFLKTLAIFLFLTLFLSCAKEKSEQSVIVVKVPPFYDKKYSQFGNYLRFQDFLFPPKDISKDEIHYPDSSDKTGLPNDYGMAYTVTIKNGQVALNSETQGSFSDTEILTERLHVIFQNNEKKGVYEPDSLKIYKAVGIDADKSVRYGDFIKVVEAVKQSGAEPIVLLFDDDAIPKAIISTKELPK